jgi:ribosomal protein S18 acetylase RimI-like enzyme
LHVDLVAECHHDSLVVLLCVLHAYYNDGAEIAPALVREHLLQNLLGAGSPHRLLVASDREGRVAGLAAITLVYSLVEADPDKRRHCQLKELYVRSSRRGQGVGRALMLGVARHAWENGCRRVDWPVKASNARGIAFYESLGAERVVERLSYRLNEAALRQLAALPAASPGPGSSALRNSLPSEPRSLPS